MEHDICISLRDNICLIWEVFSEEPPSESMLTKTETEQIPQSLVGKIHWLTFHESLSGHQSQRCFAAWRQPVISYSKCTWPLAFPLTEKNNIHVCMQPDQEKHITSMFEIPPSHLPVCNILIRRDTEQAVNPTLCFIWDFPYLNTCPALVFSDDLFSDHKDNGIRIHRNNA